MNKEELKKKIVEIMNSVDFIYLSNEFGLGDLTLDYSMVADALIAAGIGDVKEAEHRAEKAERALKDVCTNVIKEEDDLAVEPRANVLYKAYLKQAEKELAEERKDDNN